MYLNLVFLLVSLQLIKLSASANRLSKLKEQAEEYATLIMEELDPDNLGYIEVIIMIRQSINSYTQSFKL